eukprot:7536607-Ditylum_brightwellii.AAC.1
MVAGLECFCSILVCLLMLAAHGVAMLFQLFQLFQLLQLVVVLTVPTSAVAADGWNLRLHLFLPLLSAPTFALSASLH